MGRREDIIAELARRKSTDNQSIDAPMSRHDAIRVELASRQESESMADVPDPVSMGDMPQEPVDFDVGTMISNIPESTGSLVADTYNFFRYPIDSSLGVAKIGSGYMAKLLPGDQDSERYADAANEYYSNRYGGVDEFKKSLMDDPVGVLSDFAGVLAPGAMLPKVGGKISRVASAIDPINLAVSGTVKGITNIPKIRNIPKSVYKSAAKFDKKFDADKLSEVALRERIMPTEAGVVKTQGLIDDLDVKITGVINDSVNKGEKINRSRLYKHLKDVRRDLGGFNLDAAKNIKKIDNVVSEFESYIKGKGKDQITAAEVQKFKQDIYRTINFKRKKGKGNMAATDARKAIARAAKEEIENIIPEIKGMNMTQGEYLELIDALDGPAARISKRDMIGIGVPIKGVVGGSVAGPAGVIMGILSGIADAPKVKSYLAIQIRRIQDSKVTDAAKRVMLFEAIRNAGILTQEESIRDDNSLLN